MAVGKNMLTDPHFLKHSWIQIYQYLRDYTTNIVNIYKLIYLLQKKIKKYIFHITIQPPYT